MRGVGGKKRGMCSVYGMPGMPGMRGVFPWYVGTMLSHTTGGFFIRSLPPKQHATFIAGFYARCARYSRYSRYAAVCTVGVHDTRGMRDMHSLRGIHDIHGIYGMHGMHGNAR